MNNVSMVAVSGALLLLVGLAGSAAAILAENWFLMAGSANVVLAGIGFVALSWRD